MSLNFTNTGYITFNKNFNKKNKDGSFSCSMTISDKQTDGTYTTSYINGYVPASIATKYSELIREALTAKQGKGVLLDTEGIIKINEKHYPEAVVFKIFEHKNKQEKGRIYSSQTNDPNIPF